MTAPSVPTDRPRTDVEQIKTLALQDAIFKSAYFSSIATDERGVIQIFNVGAERMLGYSAVDVVDRITPADISDPQELLARAAALSLELKTPITPGFEALVFKASRGIEDIYELTYVRKDGSRFPAIVSVTSLRDGDDAIIGYLLIGTDNTARQQVDEARARLDHQLREKNLELQRASRMKSEFLATMSHELRTPLNAIIGFSEALGDGLIGPMSPSQQEYIGDIFTSGQHLLSLINDILDLSKVEAGMMELELEPADVSDLLRSTLTIVREKAAMQRVQLELVADDDLGLLQLDVRKTKQIVYNLLGNAVKFSTGDGRVRLGARRVPRSEVGQMSGEWPLRAFPLPDAEHEEFLEISVTDAGFGIAESEMATLFTAFKQVDSGLSRQFEGTGLGLAMVRQLAELHGGTVAVASAVDEGARLAVWLPLIPAPEQHEVPQLPQLPQRPRPAHSDRTVMVVEDDERAADLMRLLLEAEGFTVVRAVTGEDALLIAPAQPLNLITLDVQLPGMDGWELLSRLRTDPAFTTVPVVIVSGHVDPAMPLSLGAAAVLQKPVSRAALGTSLEALGLGTEAAGARTVLVVDDDPRAVELIAAFLPAPAYSVVRAYGGAHAISLARSLHPDLVLLDLMMPGVTGFDVVAALRADPITSRIPILVVTAKAVGPEDRDALGHDPDRTITIVDKAGFDRTSFLAEVRRAMPKLRRETA